VSPAVAIVHDYFTQRGGAERVAEHLASLFPDAPVFTSVATADATPASLAGTGRLHTTPLQALIDRGLPLAALAPLLPTAIGQLPIPADTRVVISSSSAFAQHVRVPAGAIHVAYCHTPPRFVWEPDEYFVRRRTMRAASAIPLALLRRSDAAASRRVDVFLANSTFTARRIERCYGRGARVVHPPIHTAAFEPTDERSGRFLVVARLKRHKRIDIAIEAANLAGVGLDVIGEGPEERRLRALAGPNVRFHGRLSDAAVRQAMARTAGLIVPGVEDFGMTTTEVQAAGRPPVAFARGGALEIVADGVTGFLVPEQTPTAFAEALRRAFQQPLAVAPVVASARRFDRSHFDGAIRELVEAALGERSALAA
jgi:glycosyltransferase involved in cell wall biosynthesis